MTREFDYLTDTQKAYRTRRAPQARPGQKIKDFYCKCCFKFKPQSDKSPRADTCNECDIRLAKARAARNA